MFLEQFLPYSPNYMGFQAILGKEVRLCFIFSNPLFESKYIRVRWAFYKNKQFKVYSKKVQDLS